MLTSLTRNSISAAALQGAPFSRKGRPWAYLFAVLVLAPAFATAQAPATPAETLRKLNALIDTGHASDALTQIAELRTQPSPPPGLDRVEGLADYTKGDLRQADTAFAAALKADPADAESKQMRGLTLFRLGRPADAIPLLEASSKTRMLR